MSKLKVVENNVAGRFFTTECCIGCRACRDVAPKNFAANGDGTFFVKKQPEGESEMAAVLEAYRITFAPNGPGPCIVDTFDPDHVPEEFK